MTQPYELQTAISQWETCDHCQAPLDDRQRYCVACGARRPRRDDPVARYFVAAERNARTEQVVAPAVPTRTPGSWAVALALALVPVAAALGVLAARSANSNDELLAALKAQKAPVVNVGTGTAAAAATPAAGQPKSKKASKADDPDNPDGHVIARTPYGTARRLTDATVTDAQREESRKALEQIVNSKGKEYVEQQRNLPDQIVIP